MSAVAAADPLPLTPLPLPPLRLERLRFGCGLYHDPPDVDELLERLADVAA